MVMFNRLAQDNEPFDWDLLRSIAYQSGTSNARYFQNARTNFTGDGFEPTPLEDLVGSSVLLDYIRQHLPENLGKTRVGRFLERNKPAWVDDSEAGSAVHDWAQNLPLGGYSEQHLQALDAFRQANPEVMRNTVKRGWVQTAEDPLNPIGINGRARLRGAQMAGVALGDFLQQGIPYIWWGLNAAPAVTAFATLNATHRAGDKFFDQGPPMPLLKRRVGRMLVTAPAWIGMNLATGQFGRQAGFTAASPSEADPTVASDPLSEAVSRILLGRSGQMLPYADFVKERPDVSKGEYEAYKAYLHGNKMPIKATLDGINGPEVTFLGKSVPVLTGILPAIAMAYGARRGARIAAERLSNHIDPATRSRVNLLDERRRLFHEYRKAGGQGAGEVHGADMSSERDVKDPDITALQAARVKALHDAYREVDQKIENETLRQAIGYGSIGMTGTALAGATLEALRRALKGKAPVEEDDESLPGSPPADLRAQP